MTLKQQLDKIAKKINAEVEEILYERIADDIVVDIAMPNVQKIVYEAYTPDEKTGYKRTYGLMRDWEKLKMSGRIIIRNFRNEDGKNIALTVETGEGYDYTGEMFDKPPFDYEKPRPFLATTKLDVHQDKQKYVKQLKDELKKRGIKSE